MAERFITKSFVFKGKIYHPGLQQLSEKEEAELEKRGAFEGGPTRAPKPLSAPAVVDPAAVAAAAVAAAATDTTAETTGAEPGIVGYPDDVLEPIASQISASLSVSRSSDETPLQFLERFAGESQNAVKIVEERYAEFGKERDAFEQQRSQLQSDASLADQLVEVLLPYAGDGGESEGAVDTLKRIVAERDAAVAHRDQAVAENDKLKAELTALKADAKKPAAKADAKADAK